MSNPQFFAAALTLILAGLAGYLIAGTHGAIIGAVLAGAAISWKYA